MEAAFGLGARFLPFRKRRSQALCGVSLFTRQHLDSHQERGNEIEQCAETIKTLARPSGPGEGFHAPGMPVADHGPISALNRIIMPQASDFDINDPARRLIMIHIPYE